VDELVDTARHKCQKQIQRSTRQISQKQTLKKLMHIHKFTNYVKQKFHYSLKLRLFDDQINSSNQTVVTIPSLLQIIIRAVTVDALINALMR